MVKAEGIMAGKGRFNRTVEIVSELILQNRSVLVISDDVPLDHMCLHLDTSDVCLYYSKGNNDTIKVVSEQQDNFDTIVLHIKENISRQLMQYRCDSYVIYQAKCEQIRQ